MIYDLYVIPLGTEKACLKLVTELRSHGVKADMGMSGRKLKKALDFANKQGIPYVIIIGEDELKAMAVKLKEMSTGSEYEVGLDEIVERLVVLLGENRFAKK